MTMWLFNRKLLPSKPLKSVYDTLRKGIIAFDENIKIPPTPVDQVSIVLCAIRHDDPYMFHIGSGFTYTASNNMVTSVSINYLEKRSDYNLSRSRMQMLIDHEMEFVSRIQDDFDREQQICRTIHRTIRWIEHEKDADGLTPFQHDHTALGPILTGSGTCEGLALAFTAFAQACGINASVVCNDHHAWNVVQIDGKVSHLDVGSIDFRSPSFNIVEMNRSDDILCRPPYEGGPVVGAVSNDIFDRTGMVAKNDEELLHILESRKGNIPQGLQIRVWTENIDLLVPTLKRFKRASCLNIYCETRGRILTISC